MANKHPFVQLACLCEQALLEPDGVISLVRIIDTLNLPDVPDEVRRQASVKIQAVISLKSGDLRGDYKMTLRLRKPQGGATLDREFPVKLAGDEGGAQAKIELQLNGFDYGLYWFDVVWQDGEVLTSMPLRVRPKPLESVPESPNSD